MKASNLFQRLITSFLILIPINLFVFFPENTFANSLCSEIWPPSSNKQNLSEDSPQQRKIKEYESQIKNLMDRYTQTLSPFHDPFLMAWTPEKGADIFHRLSLRSKDDQWINSSLAVINQELKNTQANDQSYNEELVQWVIDDALYWLKPPQTNQTDLQSNLLALKYATEYLRRFKTTEVIVDLNGTKTNIEKENTKENEEPPEEARLRLPSPPGYQNLPKEVRPFTKDLKNRDSGEQQKYRIAEVNLKTPFFSQRYYANIARSASHPFQETILPITFPQPSQSKSTGTELIVRTFSKKKVDLFLPPGFTPLQPTDPRASITHSETDSYTLELKEDLPEVHIPLTPSKSIAMMPHLKEIYTRPVGFKYEEWPDQIQANILRRFSKEDAKSQPLKVAQAIANHISSEYLYTMGPRKELDPIQALKSGAFQCDMAAYSMIALLRDVYEIPSRVAGGFRAKRYQEGEDRKSYLIVPGDAHVWVEVFYEGKWHLFDPTPTKKDKKDKKDEKGGKNEYSDNPLETTPPKLEQEQIDKESNSLSQKNDNTNTNYQKKLDENTQKRINEIKALNKLNPIDKKIDPDSQSKQLTSEDLADLLEIGSLELKPKPNENPLTKRALRVLLQMILNPTQGGAETQSQLNQINSLIRRTNSQSVQLLYQKALNAHNEDHPGLKNWMNKFVRTIRGEDLNKTYQELHKIRLALEIHSKVLDHGGPIPLPIDLLAILTYAQEKMRELALPDSQDMGLVQDLVKSLPSIARQLLKQLYDFSRVGPNRPTRTIAKKLRDGELNDLRLMSALSPISDFILNSTPRPESIEVKGWQRDPKRPRGQDWLPLQRFTDMTRALLGQPAKSIEANIREGTAHIPIRRQRTRIPMGYGKDEAERITIVLYDISPSMGGNPRKFQAGLIAAFTGKALSDISPKWSPQTQACTSTLR